MADSKLPSLLLLSHSLPLCAGGTVSPLFPNCIPTRASCPLTRSPAVHLHFQQHHQNVPATGKPRNNGYDLPQPLKVPPLPHSCSTIPQQCSHHSLTSKALELGMRAHTIWDAQCLPQRALSSTSLCYKPPGALQTLQGSVTRWQRLGRRGETSGQFQVN